MTPSANERSRSAEPGESGGVSSARFVEIADSTAAAPFIESWERLAAAPLERNVFAEPWLLLPAFDAFARDACARIGFAFEPSSGELTGVFPFRRAASWNRLPVSVVSSFVHEQSYLGTPLLHPDAERAKRALHAFIEAASAASLVEFDDVSGDGEFMQLLTEVIAERALAWQVTSSSTRPVLRPRENADAYISAALGGDGRRKLRSKQKGLSQLGALRVTTVADAAELDAWIDTFVKLEAAGWKGKLGTAFLNHPESRRYLETVVRDGFRRERVMALTLHSGDRPVAVKLNFRSGDEWFAYKIAYDETLSKYSPGLQLEVENIRHMHALPGARSMDSCTGRTIRVFRDLWLDRRTIQCVVCATQRQPDPLALAALPLLRWAKRTADRYVPRLRQKPLLKPSPREVAALPLATPVALPKRLGAMPFALAATAFARSNGLRRVLRHAVRLQCGRIEAREFHEALDGFFAHADLDQVLFDANYRAIRARLDASREPFVIERVAADCPLGSLVRVTAPLSIRLDFELLRAGEQIPPHGHSRVVSGFSIVQGKVGIRRYDVVESSPESVSLRPTFDGVLSSGQASTESDVRENVHWIVALEDAILFRITASDIPSRSPVPTSLNLWVDPRSPLRGNRTILGRWIPEEAARRIPPFEPRTTPAE